MLFNFVSFYLSFSSNDEKLHILLAIILHQKNVKANFIDNNKTCLHGNQSFITY